MESSPDGAGGRPGRLPLPNFRSVLWDREPSTTLDREYACLGNSAQVFGTNDTSPVRSGRFEPDCLRWRGNRTRRRRPAAHEGRNDLERRCHHGQFGGGSAGPGGAASGAGLAAGGTDIGHGGSGSERATGSGGLAATGSGGLAATEGLCHWRENWRRWGSGWFGRKRRHGRWRWANRHRRSARRWRDDRGNGCATVTVTVTVSTSGTYSVAFQAPTGRSQVTSARQQVEFLPRPDPTSSATTATPRSPTPQGAVAVTTSGRTPSLPW